MIAFVPFSGRVSSLTCSSGDGFCCCGHNERPGKVVRGQLNSHEMVELVRLKVVAISYHFTIDSIQTF